MQEIDKVREGEENNYRVATKAIQDSVSLVQDLIELYKFLADLFVSSRVPAQDDVMAAGQFLLACRYQLTLAALAALRGHINDSFYFSRKAIELCAFAARVKKHPHLAMIWLQAGHGETAYDKFREKFSPGKLFPEDHALLGELYNRYDHCSKLVHPSVYSLAGHIEVRRTDSEFNINFNYFQLSDQDPSEPIRAILWIVDTHFGILRIFEEILELVIAHDADGWNRRRDAADSKIGTHKARWRSVLQAPTG